MFILHKQPQVSDEAAPVCAAKGEKLALTLGRSTRIYDFAALGGGQFLERPDGNLLAAWREEDDLHVDLLWPIEARAGEAEKNPVPEQLEEGHELPEGETAVLTFVFPQKPKPSGAEKLSALAFQAAVLTDRGTEGENVISDDMLLASAELIDYPDYAVGVAYQKGEIIQQDGLFFEVLSDHTSQSDWPPKSTGSVYRAISASTEPDAGTLEKPIPYPEDVQSMNVESGKYYSYKGKVYLAKADLPVCVWPPDTPMWQWEEVTK